MSDSRSDPGRKLSNGTVAVLTLIVLAGVFFRLHHLDRKTFWEDEILGVVHSLGYTEAEIVVASPGVRDAAGLQRFLVLPAHDSLGSTVRSLALEDPQHPPVYYLLTHLWARAFGSSVASIRSLAAIVGILALPCAYWLALELFGDRRVAAVYAALLALSPFYVLYAQEAREYSLWTVTTLLGCIAFLRAVRRPSIRAWAIYAGLLVAGLYVFPLSGLVALGQGVYLFARERGRPQKTFWGFLLAAAAALAAFAPWLRLTATSASLRRGMSAIATEKLSLAHVIVILLRDVRAAFFDFGNYRLGPLGSSAPNALLLAATSILVAYALYVLVRRTPFEQWGFIVVALCAPPLLLVARDVLVHGSFVYQARYFTPMLLGLQLAVAFLFARGIVAGGWAWRVAFAAVLAGEAASCLVSGQAATWWNKDYERSPEVATIVNAAARPAVVSDYYAGSALELSMYLRPDVALRANLRCAQCDLAQSGGVPQAPEPAAVFVLGVPGDANGSEMRLIDARPHPVAAGDLNMFAAI